MKEMKKWIVDMYNKGQSNSDNRIRMYCFGEVHTYTRAISLYEFLFDPELGFVDIFPKHIYDNGLCYLLFSGHNLEEDHEYFSISTEIKHELLREMVISDDPLKYLEQFK